MATNKKKVAIIGSGLIGKSWAMLFTSGGYQVCLYDVEQSQLDNAMTEIGKKLTEFEAEGHLRGSLSAEKQFALISVTNNLPDCVKDARHVQECVPDVLELKKKVFEQLDPLCTDDMVLSSSSSVIPASKFTENLTNRHRCLISHPVNPPYFLPLVELVPAPWTAPDIVTTTRALMEELGQAPITVKKEIAGFIQPRIQYAIIQEAVRLIQDGVISAEGVDNIMTEGLGLRYSFMGPFETATLNGSGMGECIKRYGEIIYDIATDAGPAVECKDNPELKGLFDEMNKTVPLEELEERRRWRDEGITKLAKLKKKLNQEQNQQC